MPVLFTERTFDFCTGKKNKKMGYIPSPPPQKAEQGVSRLDSGVSRYKLDSGWDSGLYRGRKFFIVVCVIVLAGVFLKRNIYW